MRVYIYKVLTLTFQSLKHLVNGWRTPDTSRFRGFYEAK